VYYHKFYHATGANALLLAPYEATALMIASHGLDALAIATYRVDALFPLLKKINEDWTKESLYTTKFDKRD